MASNFSSLKIETKDGKILNVSEICAAIKNTEIKDEDVSYLETLCNKLANDDYREKQYTNEYPIVDTLHEVLLKYYIDEMDFGLDEVLEILKVYNKDFNDIHKLVYKDTFYLLFDNKDDIRLLSFKKEEDLLNAIYKNLKLFVTSNIKIIFDQQYKNIKEVDFVESTDDNLKEYNETFSVGDTIFYGKDINGNNLYKIKNGLYTKEIDKIFTLFTPTLNEINRIKEPNVINGFDINEFYTLNEKFKNNEYMEKEEIDTLYYEIRYLINTMQRRKKDDELSEALDSYMEDIVKIYENYPEGLSREDARNVKDYIKNKKSMFKLDDNNEIKGRKAS